MKLEVNGTRYTNFVEATLKLGIDDISSSFSFASGIKTGENIPFNMGDECLAYVDDELVLTGHIEAVYGNGNATSRVVNFAGRDLTGDLVDSSLKAWDKKAPITMKQIVEAAIEDIGADIDVIDNSAIDGKVATFSKLSDVISAENGDPAKTFLIKNARKKNLLLTSDEHGRVVIQHSAGVIVSASIIQRKNHPANNVVDYTFSYDDTKRYNKYKVTGNSNLGFLNLIGKVESKKMVNRKGSITDRVIREGRQMVLTSENSGDDADMERRAKWEANIRKAKSREFTAIVDGYRNQSGDIWKTNSIINVISENAQINDQMLINSVVFRIDPDGGHSTELSLFNKNA